MSDPRDPGVSLAFSQEDAVGAEVGEDVSTRGLVGRPEEGVGRRYDLVGHDHGDVKDFSHPEELVQVLVQSLLACGQGLPPQVLRAKVADDGVHDYEFDIFFLNDLVKFFCNQDLMVAVKRSSNNDVFEDSVRGNLSPTRDLDDSFGSKCPLRVEV